MRVVATAVAESKISMILPAIIRTIPARIRRIHSMMDTSCIYDIRMRRVHETRGEKGANQGDEDEDSHE